MRRAPVPGLLGRAASVVYSAAVARRNRGFDAGRRVTRLDRPVISVGNLSVGGTGKTPVVMHCVRTLLEAGLSPCVAMRGYKPDKGGESDEGSLYLRTFADVPVVAQPDRTAGLRDLFDSPRGREVDCVVLDDGFQHRWIGRELDLVLVDASRAPFDDRPLPAGWLREPVRNLARADEVIVTHAEMATDTERRVLEASIERLMGRPPIAVARHEWTDLRVRTPEGERTEPVSWLGGKPMIAVCAIGNPEGFLRSARRAAGGALLGELALPDHDPYRDETVERIAEMARSSRAQAIVTTEKDDAKLARVPAGTWPCPLVRTTLRIAFDRGQGELAERIIRAGRTRVEPPVGAG